MPDYELVWHGALLGFVHAWSNTKGELTGPLRQRRRPPRADPLEEADRVPAGEPSRPTPKTPPRPRLWLDDAPSKDFL
jgi:hypothetical protein